MQPLPEKISTVQQLNDLLAQPSDNLVDYIKSLPGDILILGAGGKIGPSMARRAKQAVAQANVNKRVIAVDLMPLDKLAAEGIETFQCDMLDLAAIEKLRADLNVTAPNIVYMAGRKFGSTGTEWITWAINVIVPYHVARTFTDARIAVFSTGCVYPVVDVTTGGSLETDPPDPIGEYAQSCLGRERMFDYYAAEHGEKVVQIRLNYAVELRYGVLVDIATKVYNGQPVDVTTGFANVMWQGDVCDQVLRSFDHAASPAGILNITGPETLSVRWLAHRFGEIFNKEPVITGEENGKGYLNNAAKANSIFGNPQVPVGKIIEWTADWIKTGGENIGKETHFETQNGKY